MLISILIFLVVLSILILVHELGHFIMARRAGIWVEEFGFGLPPRAFGKKIGGTIYSINWLPFGGFVRLHGEQEEEGLPAGRQGITKPRRAFLNKSKRTRIGIIIAGVIMNFLLAIVAFAIVYSFSGIPRDTNQIKVIDISQGSPALSSGIVVGDIIKKVDGRELTNVDEFIKYVDTKKGQRVNVETQRGKVALTPRASPPPGEGPLGVVITTTEIYYPPVVQRPFYGVYFGFKEALFWSKTIAVGLGSIIVEAFKGHAPKDIAGPVGIFAVTSEAARVGILTLINFVGILSVNLAILNILPFPALDGGRLLFIGIESIIGRKVIPKVEAMVHTVGMIILLVLILAITIGDVRRLVITGSIDGFIKSVVK